MLPPVSVPFFRLLPFLLLVAVTIVALPVAAQASDGERLFKEGLELLDKAKASGDQKLYAEACSKFEQSFAAEKSLSPLLNLARCEEARGRMRVALKTWQQAADLARSQGDSTAQILAQGGASSIADKLPKIVVQVGPRANGAAITIDGEAADPGAPFAVDVGKHVVVATLGAEREEKEVTVERGVVTVELLAGAAQQTTDPKPGPGPTPVPASNDTDWALPAWITFGIGVAAWGGVAATSAVWLDKCGECLNDSTLEAPDAGLNISNAVLWVAAGIASGLSVTFFVLEATDDDGTPSAPGAKAALSFFSNGSSSGLRVLGQF
jgi:tetratricopeptide (TPR) repeat protein